MTRSRRHHPELVPCRQSGVALVAALAILLILTIIGVAAMRTSSLEERMAGNIQDSTYAFEAAESALNKALNESGSISLTTNVTRTYDFGGASATVTTSFKQFAPPKRGSGFSNKEFDSANFDQQSEGSTPSGARSVVHRGVAQIVPKAQ